MISSEGLTSERVKDHVGRADSCPENHNSPQAQQQQVVRQTIADS